MGKYPRWIGSRLDNGAGAGGLVGLLVLIAAIAMLFTGRYPQSVYRLVLGMDRWSLRVVAYAALMTDQYPPFSLDQGGTDPGSLPVGDVPPQPGGPTAADPPVPIAAAPQGAS